MNTFEQTKNIIKKIFMQAKEGVITIKDKNKENWLYWLRFFANINGEKVIYENANLILDIPDFNLFVWKVDKYLQKAYKFFIAEKEYYDLTPHSFKEKLVMCLILNMSYYDAKNVYQYIDMRTKMLEREFQNEDFSLGKLYYQKGAVGKEGKIKAKIKRSQSNLEASHKMTFSIQNKDGDYALPSIFFGLVNDTAYVYAVQRKKAIEEGSIVKDLDRYFRKLNKGVDMESVEGNISPNALVSFTLFCSYMKNMGIKKIVAKDFLPLRYSGVSDGPKGLDKKRIDQLIRDQYNMTNKLMYLFLRYSHHFESCPSEYDADKGEMQLTLNDNLNVKEDNIIYDIDGCVYKSDELGLVL